MSSTILVIAIAAMVICRNAGAAAGEISEQKLTRLLVAQHSDHFYVMETVAGLELGVGRAVTIVWGNGGIEGTFVVREGRDLVVKRLRVAVDSTVEIEDLVTVKKLFPVSSPHE